MNSLSAIFLLFIFAITMIAISYFGRKKNTSNSIEEFLVSNRDVGILRGALSIAVSWVWAPAIFIVGLQAYTKGLPGVFWFVVPNIACFFLFACVATKLRKKFPNGFTLPEFIKSRYGRGKTHWAFLSIFFGYQLGAIIINSVAGGTLLHLLTGIPFWVATIGLSLTALLYSVIGGMRASIRTDVLQMIIILALSAFLVPWVIGEAGGMISIRDGFGGVDGIFGSIFNSKVAWAFGIPMTISLLAGPIGDQQFFQRAFSVRQKNIVPMFILGGIIFGIIPIILSSFGFIAANPIFGINVTDPQMVAPIVIGHFLPSWTLLLFTLMAFAGLSSTIDSAYCAISSFVIADVLDKKTSEKKKIQTARIAMITFALIGTGVSLFQPQLLWVFFIYGALVAVGFFPTIFAIFSEKYTSKAAFWSIALGFLLSIPLSLYANVSGNENLVVWSSIFSISAGLIVSLLFLAINSKKQQNKIPLFQSTFAEFDNKTKALVPKIPAQLKKMHNSDGQGVDFFIDKSGESPFGAGLISFENKNGVDMHTHQGSHILMVIQGEGILGYYNGRHPMFPGMIYNIPSNVPHSISAKSKLVLLVIGNDYRAVDNKSRLKGGGSIKNKKF